MKRAFIMLFFLIIGMPVFSQDLDSLFVRDNYEKYEYHIPMRDGVELFTCVYAPKDKSKKYPIMLHRTPYSAGPYGEDNYKTSLGPSKYLMRDMYIFVYQDVRGRWMSEGEYDNMRPQIEGNKKKDKDQIDESSDTFDTIEWLLKKIKNNNGKVGQWGISYPGHYTAAALPEAHPALVASSPQAPISDFFFDDFHHMGALLQSYLMAFPVFGYQTDGPTSESWYNKGWEKIRSAGNMSDGYEFNMALGPLKNVTEKYYSEDFFWDQVVEHPNYDDFWQKRNLLPHLKDIDNAVMTVGGWFDAEDLYGPLNIYKTIEKNNHKAKNTIVMGPWSHGDWYREKGIQAINDIYFGDSISTFYQKNIEMTFFKYYLKNEGNMTLPEAYMFDTGVKKWEQFTHWPPKDMPAVKLSFAENGKLLINEEGNKDAAFKYTSDPGHPVPYTSQIEPVTFTPRRFMTDDQRHASRRPDVLTFKTDVLTDDVTLAGEILAKLKVALSTTDADFIVKLIDVYPDTAKANPVTPKNVTMAGYQQLVRHEVFRGRFRNSFAKPEPFTPGKVEDVTFPLQDILHTFKKGHRIMIQIHSTWFPYIDRNPQKFVENIYKADAKDFQKAEITVFGSSSVEVGDKQSSLLVPDELELYKK
ncbi:CocE/NonD family hydrolase [Fulvivirga sediminis]|uniref:CocE/NonD family hydrolase n=1 Tax=Fulvivirga sediminis TaxID=2803949 RepID=A0A937K0U5_9BACT|nr:CocE/NonD family hydrolase [Fulvivirga sediminis]MBL3656741.1 CocE/NonD family hydrolase [Fulvivirga sediminis]